MSAHVSLLPTPASYPEAAAAQIGLPVLAANREALGEDLKRLRAVAEFLMEFPLDQGIEAAPVFRP
ncbi:MAG: DUF4089 domain-containing protein [Acidobacteriota bacterium]|nr:DUF4089 domain-containing protein [Acidobacteriota bacterium]